MKKPPSYPASLVSCQLFMPPSATPCPLDYSVRMKYPGEYTVMFTSVTCGPNQLKVMLGDVEIPGSPFPTWIDMRLRKAHVCERDSISVQMQCRGVSVGRKCILTATGNGVYVLNKEGKLAAQMKLRLSKGSKFEADSIAITQDNTHAFLASSRSHHIIKLN